MAALFQYCTLRNSACVFKAAAPLSAVRRSLGLQQVAGNKGRGGSRRQ